MGAAAAPPVARTRGLRPGQEEGLRCGGRPGQRERRRDGRVPGATWEQEGGTQSGGARRGRCRKPQGWACGRSSTSGRRGRGPPSPGHPSPGDGGGGHRAAKLAPLHDPREASEMAGDEPSTTPTGQRSHPWERCRSPQQRRWPWQPAGARPWGSGERRHDQPPCRHPPQGPPTRGEGQGGGRWWGAGSIVGGCERGVGVGGDQNGVGERRYRRDGGRVARGITRGGLRFERHLPGCSKGFF